MSLLPNFFEMLLYPTEKRMSNISWIVSSKKYPCFTLTNLSAFSICFLFVQVVVGPDMPMQNPKEMF